MSGENIFKIIEEKQKQYYKLQKELKELIWNAIDADVHYKGRKGTLIRIYEDSTADVHFDSENSKFKEEKHVKLSDLY